MTALAFSRLTSALMTPLTLFSDLVTEVTHALHVIPETESVTVLISANAGVAKSAVAVKHATSRAVSRFMVCLSERPAKPGGAQRCLVRTAPGAAIRELAVHDHGRDAPNPVSFRFF